jgi:hypothetical protein
MTKKSSCFYLFVAVIFYACNQHHPVFRQVPSSQSNIHFNNKIEENDSINPMDKTNVYNGGGVGIGDFNNDGLPDIFLQTWYLINSILTRVKWFLKISAMWPA